MGEIVEGDGFVWMLLPSDRTVFVRTRIQDGETAEDAGHRLAQALAGFFTSALMSTVPQAGCTSPTELARARRKAAAGG